MIGIELGSYRIDAELGIGGMGKVYRAEVLQQAVGLEPGATIALKVVHPHLLETPGYFKRFLQEVELGKRVRHPNVVRTLDVDAIARDGRHHHYMVMEYVEGKSLRELLRDLGTVPETLLREVAVQSAAGLAAIHQEGIVHRDIKPENILITDDEEIRIMDLGVAKLQEATLAITREGQFAGSLLYAAPEQFGDQPVGPAADLYSLGVLLYELATGSNPFRSPDSSAVIQAQLTLQPPPAHERNEELSPFFSELIATLLAKRPEDRLASAAELGAVLAESERSTWWVERAPALREREARLPNIRVSREAKLHGRQADLDAMQQAWSGVQQGKGCTLLLEGEAGIGKTRLIDAFLRDLSADDHHVLYGSYPPSGGLGGLSEAVLGKFGEVRLADALAPYLTVTPSLVPTFAALVQRESPPTGAEPLVGDALHAVVVQMMRALATEKPTIWIIDDLQFAPPESRDLLLAMARAVGEHRVLLIASARPGLDWAEFSRLRNFQRRSLGRLSPREVVQLLADAFRSETLAERLGGKIAVKSDGVPFFILEMVRELKERQFITQHEDGSYHQTDVIQEIEVPSAVNDLIEGRMRSLSEMERAILDAGAVQGFLFDPDLVAAVVEERPIRVLRTLAELERRHRLVRGEGDLVRFDQNQIQEVLYRDLLPKLRREYHTLLADAYEGEDPTFLAYHHLRGARPAAAPLAAALDALGATHRNDALLDLARRALDVEGLLAGEERARLLVREAECLGLVGRRDEQGRALEEALALAEGTPLLATVKLAQAAHFTAVAQIEKAEVVLASALEQVRSSDDPILEAKLSGQLGFLKWHLGRQDEAHEHLARAIEVFQQAGDRRGQVVAGVNLGLVLHDVGRYDEAREQQERARVIAEEIGFRRGASTAIGNIGNVFQALGQYTEAKQHYERHRAMSREIGDRFGEALATGNLGAACGALGEPIESRALYESQRALSIEIGDRRGEARSTGNLGVTSSRLGHYAEAIQCHRYHLALSEETGDRVGEVLAMSNLAYASLLVGRLAEARELCDSADAIGERGAVGYLRLTRAGVAEAEGEAADRHAAEAETLFRELGSKSGVSDALIARGRLALAAGDATGAAAYFEEALALAQETKSPRMILVATIELARLHGANVAAAATALEKDEATLDHVQAMTARFRLWELTGDEQHLAEAHRRQQFGVEHAPEEDRESMIANSPLHRDIARAWKERGSR